MDLETISDDQLNWAIDTFTATAKQNPGKEMLVNRCIITKHLLDNILDLHSFLNDETPLYYH